MCLCQSNLPNILASPTAPNVRGLRQLEKSTHFVYSLAASLYKSGHPILVDRNRRETRQCDANGEWMLAGLMVKIRLTYPVFDW